MTKNKIILEDNLGNEVVPVTDSDSVFLMDYNTKLTDKLKSVDTHLDNKASKNEIFSMANMGQDIKESMTGGSVAVVGINSVDVCNLSGRIQEEVGEWISPVLEWQMDTHYRGNVGEGAIINNTAQSYHSVIINGVTGDYFKVSLRTSSKNQTGLIFVDDNMIIIRKELIGSGSLLEYVDYRVVIPSGATKVIFSTYQSFENINNFKLNKLVANEFASKKYVDENVIISNESITFSKLSTDIQDDITSLNNISYEYETNKYWDTQTDVAIKTDFIGSYGCAEINCCENEEYIINMKIGTSKKQRGIVITDYDYNVLFKIDGFSEVTLIENYKVIIPKNGYRLLITNYEGYNFLIRKRVYEKIATKRYVDDVLLKSLSEKYKGKNLSIIGDSISSFAGWIPSGNKVYYNGNNSGVSSVDEMWWKRVADTLGMNVLQVEAWSGSKVSDIDSISSGFTPMSDLSRCNNLHKDGVEPDVIIIFASTNDFSKSNANIGDIGINSLPSTNDTFSNAYFLMISRIQKRYPNAEIYCCSLPVFVRTNTNKESIELNSENKTIFDYNEVIRRISNLFSCTYVDLQGCGITRQNAYPTYCIDYANTPTHPNALGHKMYADKILKSII